MQTAAVTVPRFHTYSVQVADLVVFVHTLPDARRNHIVVLDPSTRLWIAKPHRLGRYSYNTELGVYVPVGDEDSLEYHQEWYIYSWNTNEYVACRNPDRPFQVLIRDPCFFNLPYLFGSADKFWPYSEDTWNEYIRARLEYNQANPEHRIPLPGSLVGTQNDPYTERRRTETWGTWSPSASERALIEQVAWPNPEPTWADNNYIVAGSTIDPRLDNENPSEDEVLVGLSDSEHLEATSLYQLLINLHSGRYPGLS